MKNNYRIINFLRRLFKFLLVLISLKLAAGVCLNIICIFFPSFPISAGGIHFYGEAFLKSDTSYQLFGSDLFSGKSDVVLSLKDIRSENLSYRIFRLFDFAIVNLLAYFLFKRASNLFTNLYNDHQTQAFFSRDNYRIIKQIAFLLLSLWTYAVINGLMFTVFFIKDVVVQGQNLNFHPSLHDIPSLVTVLVIFVFAEIYRSGIVMQDEAELTI